jgi:hypothetical protein
MEPSMPSLLKLIFWIIVFTISLSFLARLFFTRCCQVVESNPTIQEQQQQYQQQQRNCSALKPKAKGKKSLVIDFEEIK